MMRDGRISTSATDGGDYLLNTETPLLTVILFVDIFVLSVFLTRDMFVSDLLCSHLNGMSATDKAHIKLIKVYYV